MAKQTFTTGQVLTAAQVNSLQSNDFNQTVSVKTAAYVLAAADKGTRIEFNTSGAVTCTVNTGLFDAGDTVIIQNRGAGDVTVTAGTATVDTAGSLVLSQYQSGTLYFISASASIFFAAAVGDLSAVTSGTGISISNAGGPVPTITNSMATEITASGDIIVGTGSGTFDNLPIGTTGQVLTADTTVSPYKVKWAAAAGGGKVLQVVQDTDTTQQSTTSDAYSDTNLSATITPATTGSKILCIAAVSVRVVRSGTNSLGNINLVRTSTQLAETQFGLGIGGNSAEISTDDTAVIVWLDSPSTTSATTYKVQYKRLSSATCTVYAQVSSTSSSLTLIEIGA